MKNKFIIIAIAGVILAGAMTAVGYKLVSAKLSSGKSNSNINISVSASDPYGMKAKCAEYGFFPYTPSYIPEGFVLTDISAECDDYSDSIIFLYRKKDIKLNFHIENFKAGTKIPSIGIPTDTYNIVEEEVNGRRTQILKEDSQFTSLFIENRIAYCIFAEDLDYDECYRILESLS